MPTMKRWLAVGAVLLVGVAGWIWRGDLQARYYSYKLIHAADGDADAWVDQAGAWGDRVPDRMIDCLTANEPTACSRAGAALMKFDPAAMVGRLADQFSRLSPAGQQAALDCVATIMADHKADVSANCRRIVRPALQSTDAKVRLRGAALAQQPEIGQTELLIPLLKDPSAEVRRAVVVAVGPSRDLLADDDLLSWLNDPDAGVRRMTEAALKSRGLRAADVHLGRLLTDPRPTARLELLVELSSNTELDITAWLKRLSDDPSPAVRAATARLAEERHVFQLTDRLAEMARSDPDMTVRQAVSFHLGRLQSAVRSVGAP
jgi:hypothetical protein